MGLPSLFGISKIRTVIIPMCQTIRVGDCNCTLLSHYVYNFLKHYPNQVYFTCHLYCDWPNWHSSDFVNRINFKEREVKKEIIIEQYAGSKEEIK